MKACLLHVDTVQSRRQQLALHPSEGVIHGICMSATGSQGRPAISGVQIKVGVNQLPKPPDKAGMTMNNAVSVQMIGGTKY
jgi:hypothetical protein